MEGHCEAMTDYTDKSTFETEESMLTSRFLKKKFVLAINLSVCVKEYGRKDVYLHS